MTKKYPPTAQLEKLRILVEESGGNKAFAEKYSCIDDDPINPVFIGHLLNGDRPFRDRARENMARRAGLPVGYFETMKQETASCLRSVIPIETRQMKELIVLMQGIDDDLQSQILGAAKLLIHHAGISVKS